MDTLAVGDHVQTGVTKDGKHEFSHVLSFLHRHLQAELEYIQIFTNDSPQVPLEISADHLLYLRNGKVVRARDVRGSRGETIVLRIESIHRQGLFAPETESGTIWVSGVMASTYVSLLDSDEFLSAKVQTDLYHMALAPLRIVCGSKKSFSMCHNETYTEDGYSTSLKALIDFGVHFTTLTLSMQLFTLMAVVPLLMMFVGTEMILKHGIEAIVVVVRFVIFTEKTKLKTYVKHNRALCRASQRQASAKP